VGAEDLAGVGFDHGAVALVGEREDAFAGVGGAGDRGGAWGWRDGGSSCLGVGPVGSDPVLSASTRVDRGGVRGGPVGLARLLRALAG
jgi:hypothetical protein